MSDCPRRGAWIGCNFEPRYDLSPADISRFESIKGNAAPLLEALRSKTYVHDICVRCGRVVERNAATASGAGNTVAASSEARGASFLRNSNQGIV